MQSLMPCTSLFLQAGSLNLQWRAIKHTPERLEVIKATPGLIFKHWEFVLALCANRANDQAVIKMAF